MLMQKQNPLLIFCLLCLMLVLSCKKQENIPPLQLETNHFFNSEAISEETKKVFDFLKQFESNTTYFEKFITRNGNPIWDKSIKIQIGNQNEIFIPLVKKEDNQVLKLLRAHSRNDGTFDLMVLNANSMEWYKDNEKNLGLSTKIVSLLFLESDFKVFGHNIFNLKDNLYLENSLNSNFIKLNTKRNGWINPQYSIEGESEEEPNNLSWICIDFWLEKNCTCGVKTPEDCDWCDICVYKVCSTYNNFDWLNHNPFANAGSNNQNGGGYFGNFAWKASNNSSGSGGHNSPPIFDPCDLSNMPPPPPGQEYPPCESGAPTPWEPVESPSNEFDDFFSTLSQEQLFFLQSPGNVQFKALFMSYLIEKGFTTQSKDFIDWGIDFMLHNPTTTIEEFDNWFMGEPEGPDSEYDVEFWEDQNNTFTKQELPSWSNFSVAFPGRKDPRYNTSKKMFENIGGDVYSKGYTGEKSNTCAIRLSKALNESGVKIPYIPKQTFKGKDKDVNGLDQYYFLGAANMITWMKKVFGTTDNENYSTFTTVDVNNGTLINQFSNKTGIYCMLPVKATGTGSFNATGHVDLMVFGIYDGNGYSNPPGGLKEIVFWNLK